VKSFSFFSNYLFSQKCLGCGKKGAYFCSSCLRKIKVLGPQFSLKEPPLDLFFSIFAYEGLIRKALLKIKYKFVFDLVNELADLAFRSFGQNLSEYSNCLVLVPVPLYWYRQNWRGFNQTEALGKKLAQKLKIGFCSDLLLRFRSTKPQVKLKGRQRKMNVKGAFKLNPKYHQFRNDFLLFDDVWTTGETMKECARVLKKAGAKKVFGLTLAR
jgi:ComF family protein